MKDNPLTHMFLHAKPSMILMSLRNGKCKYASIISKETDCTYTHTLKILDELEKNGVVEFAKEGRIKTVTLTRRGEDIAHELEGLIRHLQRVGEEADEEEQSEESSE